MPLTGTQKTNVTAVDTALSTALASLSSVASDTSQLSAYQLLRKFQADLQMIADIRTQ